MTTGQDWLGLYKAAVLETDWSKLGERVRAAESAIAERLRAFALNHGGTPEENQAIVDALHKLKVLTSEAATWRASNTD